MHRLKRTLRRPRSGRRTRTASSNLDDVTISDRAERLISRDRPSRGTTTPLPGDESPVAAIVSWSDFDQDDDDDDDCNDSSTNGGTASDSLADLLSRPADRDRAISVRQQQLPVPARRARWRRLLARKELLENGLATGVPRPADRFEETGSPRSSFDLDEPKSFASWDEEPPSPTLRSWRSVSSRSFQKRAEEPPRALAAIGRQPCMNDISHLVDAANSPCISYDRQIFDPTSKMWRYVEFDIPYEASPRELGPASLGSPVTTKSTAMTSNSVTATPSLPTLAAMHAAASDRRKPTRGEMAAFTRAMSRRHRRPWSPAPGPRRTANARRFPSAHSEDGYGAGSMSSSASLFGHRHKSDWGTTSVVRP